MSEETREEPSVPLNYLDQDLIDLVGRMASWLGLSPNELIKRSVFHDLAQRRSPQ